MTNETKTMEVKEKVLELAPANVVLGMQAIGTHDGLKAHVMVLKDGKAVYNWVYSQELARAIGNQFLAIANMKTNEA